MTRTVAGAGFKVLDRRVSDNQHKDYDGRPSVDLFENDPLLTRLLEIHGEPRFDIFPGLQK